MRWGPSIAGSTYAQTAAPSQPVSAVQNDCEKVYVAVCQHEVFRDMGKQLHPYNFVVCNY